MSQYPPVTLFSPRSEKRSLALLCSVAIVLGMALADVAYPITFVSLKASLLKFVFIWPLFFLVGSMGIDKDIARSSHCLTRSEQRHFLLHREFRTGVVIAVFTTFLFDYLLKGR